MKAPKSKKETVVDTDVAIPGVDLVQVKRVLDFMASHNLEEFEYAGGGLHIRLKRSATGRGSSPVYIPVEISDEESAPGPSGSAEATVPEPAARPVQPKEELHIIKSPIVGTFYLAPGPDAPPFVKVGDSIQSGQVVCIVEAMKLMNEIEADMSGEIVGVLAENGQPVEYGQSLFALRPAKKKK